MKVSFCLFYPPTVWAPGGVAVQLERSKAALEALGVRVCLFSPWDRSRDFDVLHVFGSTHEVSGLIDAAKGLGKPTVVSAVFSVGRSPWKGWLAARAARLVPLTTVHGLRRQLLHRADVVLATSRAEADAIRSRFGLDGRTLRVLPVGVDAARFRDAREDAFRDRYGLRDFVLQVGRVNRRKGQARLVRALDGLGLELVIVGPEDPTDPSGVREFRALIAERPWVHYLGPIPHDDPLLASAFKAARVHVLPSASESLGLVTLEAAAAGCAVVTGAHGPIVEYLGGRGEYVDPMSEPSIRRGVTRAHERGADRGLAELVRERYSWESVGARLADIYASLVDRRGNLR